MLLVQGFEDQQQSAGSLVLCELGSVGLGPKMFPRGDDTSALGPPPVRLCQMHLHKACKMAHSLHAPNKCAREATSDRVGFKRVWQFVQVLVRCPWADQHAHTRRLHGQQHYQHSCWQSSHTPSETQLRKVCRVGHCRSFMRCARASSMLLKRLGFLASLVARKAHCRCSS
jgi:hypothetical protein